MERNVVVDNFLANGKKLTILNGKVPIKKDWRNAECSMSELLNCRYNLGWVLGRDDLVIDIDNKKSNQGNISWSKLCDDLNINDLDYSVKTINNGYHIYLKLVDFEGRVHKTLREYQSIDFLSVGCFCVIPPSIICSRSYEFMSDKIEDRFTTEAPVGLVNLLANQNSVTINHSGHDLSCVVKNEQYHMYWDEDTVKSKLDKLNPNMCNDEWVKVGMALHNWHPIDGLKLWEDWSKGGDNYTVGETAKRWSSFDNVDNGVTLGTLSYMHKSANYDDRKTKLDELVNTIKCADSRELELNILPKIKKTNLFKLYDFNDFEMEVIVKTICDTFKKLTGVKPSVKNIRSIVRYSGKEVNTDEMTSSVDYSTDTPSWCKDWVYINSHSCFCNLTNMKILKTEAFNICCGKYVPYKSNNSATKVSASKYLSDNGYIRIVDTLAYLPTVEQKIYENEGWTTLNTFNVDSLPRSADEFSEGGLATIERIKRHIKFIFTSDENSEIFTNWLAHQIQYPGKQLLWSPIVQGIQGVGKSFFGELLRMCLGDRNVGTVSSLQIVSNFNGWSTGVAVNILEELWVRGHNRHDAINALKPLITDRIIQINNKGVKQYNTYNTTNYICFTNHKDSLPIDEDDRRWWVIFNPITDLTDLKNYVGEDSNVYFRELFNGVRMHSHEVVKWLSELHISDDFLNLKRAPMTDDKLSMIATEEACTEGLQEIKIMLIEGNKYYNDNYIVSKILFNNLEYEYPALNLSNRSKSIILKKLGYISRRIKIKNKTELVWVRNNYHNEEIIKILS